MNIPHTAEIGITVALRSGTDVTVPSALLTLWCVLPLPGGGVTTVSVVVVAEKRYESKSIGKFVPVHAMNAY
jgi:hypothetical protein